MQYRVKVRVSKAEAFQKILESLQETGVIESFESNTKQAEKTGKRIPDNQKEKSTSDFVKQYRDLVD